MLLIMYLDHFQGWIISHFSHIIGWKVVPTYTEDWSCVAIFLSYMGNNANKLSECILIVMYQTTLPFIHTRVTAKHVS